MSTVGGALIKLLDDEIPAERARKGSLEARGLAVITTSGVLVSLLLALGALVSSGKDYRIDAAPLVLLAFAAVCFTAAAGIGIYTNVPGRYAEIDPESLQALTGDAEWERPGEAAARQLALARLLLLADWRRANEMKARWLVGAATAEVAGVLLTAVAVLVVLLTR